MFTNKKIHFIGIGGISMSGIAQILLSFNCKITGYDMQESDTTRMLEQKGIKVSFEYNLKNIEESDIVVYTAAIKDDNEELAYAKKLNKELYERSVFLGLMMRAYKDVICISGTHGKSTTTGMVSTVFMKLQKEPTIQIGAMLPIIHGNSYVGNKDYFIAEACEYVDSFLDFFPTCEIILNIDNDHLDYFHNLDNIIHSFKRYINLLPENGYLIINNDDENTRIAANEVNNKTTYGINEQSNYMAKNITFDEFGHPNYDLFINNEYASKVSLSVNGIHNVYNSLATIAACHKYIEDINLICESLKDYTGVGRRFEFIGTYNNANIYDDYAHHPSEILTTLNSVKQTKHNESWAIFQSHTYSRTFDHLKEFADVLKGFDHIVIAKIYPARETNTWNVKEEQLVNLIKENGNQNVNYIEDFNDIETYIKENIKDNDLVISIGAGPINKVTKNIVNKK